MSNFNNGVNNFGINQLNNNINLGNYYVNPTNFNFNISQNNTNQNYQNINSNINQQYNIPNFYNSFNNMNSYDTNLKLKPNNSEEINQRKSINNLEKEIIINFNLINGLNYKIKAKLKEKFIDVVNRFRNNNCPIDQKNLLNFPTCHGKMIINLNKTLLELNIKNGEEIIFINYQSKSPKNYVQIEEEDDDDGDDDIEDNEYILTQREKELIRIMKLKYDNIYLNKELNNNLNLNQKHNKIPDFIEFIESIDSEKPGIIVKEHGHLLVYCLTNLNYICNICKKIYSKDNMKYYCSLCDYNMCENCHFERKYFMKKSFPFGVKPSNTTVNIHFLQTDYHKHRLVFCRTSRRFTEFGG